MSLEEPKSPYTMRPATKADADSISALWLAHQREHESMDDRYVLSEDAGTRWRNDFLIWVEDTTHGLFLWETESETIGFVHAYLYASPPIYAYLPEVFIDDIYVAPSHRRQGLAKQMVDYLQAWAIEKGAERIRLRALSNNEGGLAFWTDQGGTSYVQTYTISLNRTEKTPQKMEKRRIGF